MDKYFDYEKEQKGYSEICRSRQSIKANIGKKVVYLLKSGFDSLRGYMYPKCDIIHSIRYSQVFTGDGHDSFDVRDLLEIAVKNETVKIESQ